MNRFKKELRKQGVKLECDYPYIPYDLVGQTLGGIVVNSEKCTVTTYTTSIILIDYYDRSMQICRQVCH